MIEAKQGLTSIQKEVEALEQDYLSQKDNASEAQNTFDENRRLFNERREQVFSLRKEIEIKEIQLDTLNTEFAKTESDTTEQSETLAQFDEKLNVLEKEVTQKRTGLEKAKVNDEKHQKSIQQTSDTLDIIREELTQIGRKLDSKRNEYSLTKSLVENLEGFPEAIKFLKKKANWNKNAPLLSDIITCDEKYRVTIENYLEAYMNYYIVDTERQAFEAVNILSDSSKGKANFFVLDALDHYEAVEPRLFENAIPATEIVEYEPKYRRLISHILENVYIVKGGRVIFRLMTEPFLLLNRVSTPKRNSAFPVVLLAYLKVKELVEPKILRSLKKTSKIWKPSR